MNPVQVNQLVLHALTHEQRSLVVYGAALLCVQDDGLREEWERCLEQTREHVEALTRICLDLDLDLEQRAPGRDVVQYSGSSLVAAMKMALAARDPEAAERLACDCVVLAETVDHGRWRHLGRAAPPA